MDRALILLHLLRLKAFLRRWGKNLRTVKGVLFTLVGLLVFMPWLYSLFFSPRMPLSMDLQAARRFGPMSLFAFALLSLAFSSGERMLFFTPAEIAFLFPGPFTRKALLRYKIIGMIWGCLFSSMFMTLALGRANRHPLSAYLAISLTFLFFQFMTMAVGLATQTLGEMARTNRRRLVLGLFVAIIVLTIGTAGRSFLELAPAEMLSRLEASPVLHVVTIPFQPFIEVYTAERIWPDLIGWSAVCVAMNLAMILLVFATDAQYLESAAISSEKLYQRILRMQKGGTAAGGGKPLKAQFGVPMLPWLGGVGPIFWRQLSTASRHYIRVIVICSLVLVLGSLPVVVLRGRPDDARAAVFFGQGLVLYLTIFITPIIAFDFRGDVDRMEVLKSLPTSPLALVIGQILTPVCILALPSFFGIGLASIWVNGIGFDQLAAVAMALPAVFLVVGIENLLFLLFPSRSAVGGVANPADFAMFGRQIFLIFTKVLALALLLGASALMAVAAFYLLGASRAVAFLIAFAFASTFAALLVPLMAWAFLRYDVARDTPA